MKTHPRATEDRPGRLLQLNTILPEQFFSLRHQRGWSGEQRLMAAILVDALAVFSRRAAPGVSDGYVLRQTLHWLRSNDRTSACSFLRVCEVLGLEPDAVRRHLDDEGDGEAARGRHFIFARLKSPRRLVGG